MILAEIMGVEKVLQRYALKVRYNVTKHSARIGLKRVLRIKGTTRFLISRPKGPVLESMEARHNNSSSKK